MKKIVYNNDTLSEGTYTFLCEDVDKLLNTLKKSAIVYAHETYILENTVYDILCSICEQRKFDISEADVTLHTHENNPYIYVQTNNDIQCIYMSKVNGNCVDKFMYYHQPTLIERVRLFSELIFDNCHNRISTNDYHNTNTFEEDFANLTKLREACDAMSASIRKFQEDLVLGY